METKYGPNWKAEHPNFDAAVIYDNVGRMPHGKLGLGDEAISISEKEVIKTRKRSAHPIVSAREKRLERDIENLRKENSIIRGVEHVVRILATKGGLDYDALASNLGNTGARDGSLEDEEYDNYGDEDYDHDDDQDYNNDDENYGRGLLDDDYEW
ncbi:hypothetical protein PVAP13_3NG177400 [Panicum virgatum]|uniref:Uncharacterized protein n=1 Tax=Panicum virgatum TaxID=38727 RepID=A0A8T0UEY9_PANVG|nr:hypothetical protein PVAP13_3NG177400 [Panicum virgatum]